VLAAKAQAAAAGVDGEQPLDYLLRIMRDPTTEPHRRDAAAKAAAAYCHPTMQAVAHRLVDATGAPVAPVINLTINAPAASVELPRPKLTVAGPKEDDTVQ
jgi:hypothetical protein